MKIEGSFDVTKPDGYKWFGDRLTVAGTHYRLDKLKKILKSGPDVLDFYPVLEPDNQYDKNAIALYLSTSAGDVQVGYVDAETAEEIVDAGVAPVMKVFLWHIKIEDDVGWIDYSIAVPKSDQKLETSNLIPCEDCGNKVSRRAVSCPKCGAPISTTNQQRKLVSQATNQTQQAKVQSYHETRKTESKGLGCLSYIGAFLALIGVAGIISGFSDKSDERVPVIVFSTILLFIGTMMGRRKKKI